MTPPRNTILTGDALTRLAHLETGSIDCVVTSPPYFRLRDYQHPGQIGLESSISQWADALLRITDEIGRVLVPTGTLWLNLGDTYSTHPREGAARKSLLMAPQRLTLALLEHGWILRNQIIWAKANAIPSSVTDRLSSKYEMVFLLTRYPRYFFDLDAIRETPLTALRSPRSHPPRQPRSQRRTHPRQVLPTQWHGPSTDPNHGLDTLKRQRSISHPLGKNPGDVWRLPTSHYSGAHFATYPTVLAERMVLAGCPERRCTQCRRPYKRPVRRLGRKAVRLALGPTCTCPPPPNGAPAHEPGIVLDPFIGSGTTAIAAEKHGRDWLGIELNPDFVDLATERIHASRTTTHTTRKENA